MSVLEKATQILDVVAETPDGATLTSIAQRLGQPRSSIHRLLSELVQLGLLFRVGHGELRARNPPGALGRGGGWRHGHRPHLETDHGATARRRR